MKLGAFSISLAVKDLTTSLEFYTKLGFEPFGGDGQNYSMLRNGETVIGLFQGMFDQNILTFNPGWNQQAGELDSFTDIRELHAQLEKDGMPFAQTTVADSESGPASFMITDPDGNPILVDQHR